MLYNPFPAALRSVRLRAGLTRHEVAARVHVRELTWSRWETGARKPHANQLPAILDALGCTHAELELAACRAYCEHCNFSPVVIPERPADPRYWRPVVTQFLNLVDSLWDFNLEKRRRQEAGEPDVEIAEPPIDPEATAAPEASSKDE